MTIIIIMMRRIAGERMNRNIKFVFNGQPGLRSRGKKYFYDFFFFEYFTFV